KEVLKHLFMFQKQKLMFHTNLFLVLNIICLGISCTCKSQGDNLFEKLEELTKVAYEEHVILEQEDILFLVSSNKKTVKVIVWNQSSCNELLSTFDSIPIGYVSKENYDVIFMSSTWNIDLINMDRLQYYSKAIIDSLKADLKWKPQMNTPPPSEPPNINYYIYQYDFSGDEYKLNKKGDNISFP
ncbi:MAG: hypothetical protein AB8G22_25610, partial [Saprospiraceae bacterium]